MPKLKVFLWQLCHASLPTRGVLFTRGLHIDPLCPHCHSEIEDAEHLFLGCHAVQHVWRLANDHTWLKINIPLDYHHSVQDWLATLRLSTHLFKMDRLVSLLWSIWKSRNNAVFRKESSNPVITLIRAKRACAEWRVRHALSHSLQPSHLRFPLPNHKKSYWVAWHKPQGGFIKINFDGPKSP